MKPFRIFLFFTVVLLLLSLVAWFIPEHGIGINGNWRITFLSPSDLFREPVHHNGEVVERLMAQATVTEDPEADADPVDPEGADSAGLTKILEGNPVPGASDPGPAGTTDREAPSGSGPPAEAVPGSQVRGSAPTQGASSAQFRRDREEDLFDHKLEFAQGSGDAGMEDAVEEASARSIRRANADSLQRSVYPILFTEAGRNVLTPFFQSLDELKDGAILRTRILHFGDSQIENDRMTALIRYRLQKSFGGTGTGLVQAIPLYSGSMAYQQEQEGTWLRYTYFRNRDSTINHNTYGVMAAFASVPTPTVEGWPMLHYSFNLARRSGRCDRVKVFMHSYVNGASMVFCVNDTISDTIRNLPAGYSVADYRQVGIVKDLKLYLNFPEGGRIYGISFESYTGVQMDNIAMRGSGGLIFTKMDREQQEEMMEQLAPSLILLQYGGNVVPYMNPRYYRKEFEKELAFFKEICPNVPVVVIGPADMSIREKGEFKTYPGLEKIRDALKSATLESGFAFWDLYEAMGGHNSMPSFVHAEPPLASADYVHFNGLGINVVAEMFYNALMMEYDRYTQQMSQP